MNTTKQSRETGTWEWKSEGEREHRFCIFAIQQNKSEIIAPAVHSSITHKPEQQKKRAFVFIHFSIGITLVNKPRKLRNALKGFNVLPINYNYAQHNLSSVRNQIKPKQFHHSIV